jgi:hypothetical protein
MAPAYGEIAIMQRLFLISAHFDHIDAIVGQFGITF